MGKRNPYIQQRGRGVCCLEFKERKRLSSTLLPVFVAALRFLNFNLQSFLIRRVFVNITMGEQHDDEKIVAVHAREFDTRWVEPTFPF